MEPEVSGGMTVISAKEVAEEVRTEVNDLTTRAEEIAGQIVDTGSYTEAADFAKEIDSKAKFVKDKMSPICDNAHAAWKAAVKLRDDAIGPLTKAKKIILQALGVFDTELERQRRIKEEARQAEIRRQREEQERKQREHDAEVKRIKEENERKEREHQAELKRLDDERIAAEKKKADAKKAEEDRIQAERQKEIDKEEASRVDHAQEAEDQGNGHKSDHILETPQAIPQIKEEVIPSTPPAAALPPPPAPEPPKLEPIPAPPPPPPPPPPPIVKVDETAADGVIRRDIWKAELTDIKALAKAVVSGDAPYEFLEANMPLIRARARKLKKEFSCPGIRAWPERSTAVKS